jgi:hypothetical protein
MQVSKFLLTVCTTAVCAGIISVHAQDNPAQAAARAALMEKIGETDTQAEQTKNAPVLIDSSGVVTPPPAPTAETNQISTPPDAPAVAVPMAPMPAKSSLSSDNEAQAKARAALLEKMSQQPDETPTPMTPAPTKPLMPEVKPVAVIPADTTHTNYPGKELGFTPIVAPPLPISMTKEQQLDALLAQYKADQISPGEYQKQRAAILAQPDSVSH